jgi:hypothetical protein
MALLDSLLGGNLLGGLLGGILGGGASAGGSADIGGSAGVDSSAEVDAKVVTDPSLELSASDILTIDGGDGLVPDISVGDIGLGFSAPTFVGVSVSEETSVGGSLDGSGGLLGGLA